MEGLFADMRNGGIDRGIPLTDAPEIFIQMDSGRNYKLFKFTELASQRAAGAA